MISTIIDVCLITMAVCITLILVSATVLFLKEMKDDLR